MAGGGKEAERQRLAEALRANLKRRKTAKPAPGRASPEAPEGAADQPGPDGERGEHG